MMKTNDKVILKIFEKNLERFLQWTRQLLLRKDVNVILNYINFNCIMLITLTIHKVETCF